jgi:hypothetical protein
VRRQDLLLKTLHLAGTMIRQLSHGSGTSSSPNAASPKIKGFWQGRRKKSSVSSGCPIIESPTSGSLFPEKIFVVCYCRSRTVPWAVSDITHSGITVKIQFQHLPSPYPSSNRVDQMVFPRQIRRLPCPTIPNIST